MIFDILSAVAGAAAAVVSTGVYTFVKSKIVAPVAAKVAPVAAKVATVEATVKADVADVVAEVKKAI
jgi:hypothetical protein